MLKKESKQLIAARTAYVAAAAEAISRRKSSVREVVSWAQEEVDALRRELLEGGKTRNLTPREVARCIKTGAETAVADDDSLQKEVDRVAALIENAAAELLRHRVKQQGHRRTMATRISRTSYVEKR